MHKNMSRTLTGVFLALLAVIGFFGINAASGFNAAASEDYHNWRQMDERWGGIYIGDYDTMARSGCLVTSIAIMAASSGAVDPDEYNPGTLANALKQAGGFTSGGAIASWAMINKVLPDVNFVETYYFSSWEQNGKIQEMQALTQKGYYLISQVGGHWVYIESINGSDVRMIDPASDSTSLFNSYSNENITELKVFTSKNLPSGIKFSEYVNNSDDAVKIYSSQDKSSSVIAEISAGQYVKLFVPDGNMGCVILGSDKGWVDVSRLSPAEPADVHKTGDINGDGTADTLDLAMLNDYIDSIGTVHEGISILRECEEKAADINSDGVVDDNDVLELLALICV